MKCTRVDVRGLAPPEPMTIILNTLSSMIEDECLLVRHNRQPFPLYEKLVNAGWAYHCHEASSEDIWLYIFRQASQPIFDKFLPTQTFT